MARTLYVASTNPGKLRDFALAGAAHGMLILPLPGLEAMTPGSQFLQGLGQATNVTPEYFAAAASSYLALGVIALFTSVPKSERAYVAPIVPICAGSRSRSSMRRRATSASQPGFRCAPRRRWSATDSPA